MTADSIQFGMFAATVGLVLVSVGSVGLSYLLLRSHVDPEVIVYTKHDDKRPTLLVIVIENIGAGVAYDVKFELSNPIPARAFRLESSGESGKFNSVATGPLINGIPMLAPGERRVITWGQYGGLVDELGPEPVQVKARFLTKRRFPRGSAERISESVLDVFSFEATDASEPPEVRVARELENLVKQVGKVERSIGQIAGVVTRPEVQAAYERARARLAEQAQSDNKVEK